MNLLRRLRPLAALAAIGCATSAAEPLRVCLVSADTSARDAASALRSALDATRLMQCTSASFGAPSEVRAEIAALRAADVAVFLSGPGPVAAETAGVLRAYLATVPACVVLGAGQQTWATFPGAVAELLGASPGQVFAKGAPISVINLFAHPIFTGVSRLETNEPFPVWNKLADDAQIIMEGTVGEETTALGWVRVPAARRICHLAPSAPDTLRDPAYQRIVAQAILWSAHRPIPGAQPAVQRTYMAQAFPGAIAITFPAGPGVCLDPVRGGINYIWDGDFVDLRPRWLTKQGAPARVFGGSFYTESLWQPLRAGAPDAAPSCRFRGYTLQEGGPEFHYDVGGREVHETLTALPGGDGILRRFRVAAGQGTLWLTLEPQAGSEVVVSGISRDGDRLSFASAAGGEFTITIRRRSGGKTP